MERSRWTDERLDDLAGGIGNRFDQVDKRFDQVDNRFAQVDKRFDRVDREFDRVHQDIRELRQWIFRLTIGMSVGFISVLSAILVSRRLIGVLSIEAGPAAECSPPTRQPPTAHSAPRGARWGLLD